MRITRPRATKLSQITIDADLAMVAHDITLGVGQLVDGKDVSELTWLRKAVASDTVLKIDNTLYETNALSYTKLIEVRVPYIYVNGSVFRIKMSIDSYKGGDGVQYCKIYKDGVTFGTQRTSNDVGVTEYIENLAFEGGEMLEFWGYSSTGTNAIHLHSFSACADYSAVEWE